MERGAGRGGGVGRDPWAVHPNGLVEAEGGPALRCTRAKRPAERGSVRTNSRNPRHFDTIDSMKAGEPVCQAGEVRKTV